MARLSASGWRCWPGPPGLPPWRVHRSGLQLISHWLCELPSFPPVELANRPPAARADTRSAPRTWAAAPRREHDRGGRGRRDHLHGSCGRRRGDHPLLLDVKEKKGLDIPLHIDGASGGFVWPFLYPQSKWDFRLEQVRSINASGHKFGLVYPGIGWLIFREKLGPGRGPRFGLKTLSWERPTRPSP